MYYPTSCGLARLRIKALLPVTATLSPRGRTAQLHAEPHLLMQLILAPEQASPAMRSGEIFTESNSHIQHALLPLRQKRAGVRRQHAAGQVTVGSPLSVPRLQTILFHARQDVVPAVLFSCSPEQLQHLRKRHTQGHWACSELRSLQLHARTHCETCPRNAVRGTAGLSWVSTYTFNFQANKCHHTYYKSTRMCFHATQGG